MHIDIINYIEFCAKLHKTAMGTMKMKFTPLLSQKLLKGTRFCEKKGDLEDVQIWASFYFKGLVIKN